MFDHVLVPTDGSDGAERALGSAIEIARRYGSTLHVLYVVDLGGLPVDADGDTWTVHRALEREGESVTAAAQERAERAGVDRVRTAVVDGRPHRVILDYVAENGIDLVAMGTHGRRGLDRLLLGSVTARVVRTAPVPVLTVRAAADPTATTD